MDLFRVFPYGPQAPTGEPGHPLYLHHGQTIGRWDNARLYDTWYSSESAAGAAGETFGNLAQWRSSMFDVPFLPGARRALAVLEADDDLPLLNLDDARELVARNVRPSQIVIRDPAFTQPFAGRVFREQNADGSRRWAGIRWWSFHRPLWANVALWHTADAPAPVRLVRVEELSLEHPAIVDAAELLVRELK